MQSFFLPMIPPTKTQQQHRLGVTKCGKPFVYNDAELMAAKAKLKDNLAAHVPEEMFTCPVRLVVKWCFPVTSKHKNGEYKGTKPDTDNLQKMLKDVMTELHFWKDDALVASEIVEKFYADIPGIFIAVTEAE